MTFLEKFNQSVASANPDRDQFKVKHVLATNVPADSKFWTKEDMLRESRFVTVKACNERRRKDGSVFYSLILEDMTEVLTDNPCASGVAHIVTIPAGTYTMKFDANAKKYSDTEVSYREFDFTRVLGSGVLTYGMKLKQQIAEKIISAASVDI